MLPTNVGISAKKRWRRGPQNIRLEKWIMRAFWLLLGAAIVSVLTRRNESIYTEPSHVHAKRPVAKVLAIYFPQFHEFDVNNALWGQGYTDFVGVKKVSASSEKSAAPGYPVIRPRDGFYDLTFKWTRERQARLAQSAGIHGFIYYHYWFDGGPVMEKPLKLLLEDGQPDIPFAISWANENWTKRWDGGNNKVLMEQTYKEEDWRPHFDWLARFFSHPLYIRKNGKPLLFLYRIHDLPDLSKMLAKWRKWSVDVGLGGLYVIQTNGFNWSPTVYQKADEADGVMEFYPGFYWRQNSRDLKDMLTQPSDFNVSVENYMYGAHAGWNNRPRHVTDGNDLVVPYHPVNLHAVLRQQLRRSHPDSFVVINAWNEWGEGSAIEPSVEFGDGWLRAIEDGIREASTWEREIELAPSGVGPLRASESDRVCLVVRTHVQHDDDNRLFNLRKSLATLLALEHRHWDAFIVDTGEATFENLGRIVSGFKDNRLYVVDMPKKYAKNFQAWTSYDLTDYAINKHCASYRWFLATKGDDFYAPDALNYLPSGADAVFMNFYSRYTLANELQSTDADASHCCTRFQNGLCHAASPVIGHVDVGGMIIRMSSWSTAALSFAQFHDACGTNPCHDGALAEHASGKLKWNIYYHDPGSCALMHNPNPAACALVGGVYYDAPDWHDAGCYEPAVLAGWSRKSPIAEAEIDWSKYMSNGSCVCKRAQSHSR